MRVIFLLLSAFLLYDSTSFLFLINDGACGRFGKHTVENYRASRKCESGLRYWRNTRRLAYTSSSSLKSNDSSSSSWRESSDEDVSYGGFDADFADLMSKPLPDWFQKEQEGSERFMADLEANRQKIKDEFRTKYEVTEEEKMQELHSKWELIEENAKRIEDRDPTAKYDGDTKKQWRKFWTQEEKDTGFYLPGFFEVFPELRFLWPTWARRRDGGVIECLTDEDCVFPQACCPHPILPGKKFCCTGTGQRILVPQYCPQELISEDMLGSPPREEEPMEDDPNWLNGGRRW